MSVTAGCGMLLLAPAIGSLSKATTLAIAAATRIAMKELRMFVCLKEFSIPPTDRRNCTVATTLYYCTHGHRP